MDVLLVIDMQQGLFDSPRHQDAQVIANINRLADGVRASQGRVIYVQHDEPGSELEPHSPGWQLHRDLTPAPGESRVRKTACDSFLDTELGFLLAEQAVDRLLISGCATDFCVDTTLRSAASKGFDVTVLTDAHTTADRPHLSAEQIIEHHHWMWQHLSLSKGRSVTLLTTDQLLGVTQPVSAC
ncbi:cysteine hydrolase family protein [Aeromonas sp. MR16]|uniref:cysteine hydrolase family protein n=1 Tax=Aeromonas sp. MR16 TaxID=2923420 RepID=UPI001F4B42AE|nr:cysteine hydrolase family protein [Aeromonas sp. MR16]MCH7371818.1 cysteine hydrolase [Aeromonas sp. MR16]